MALDSMTLSTAKFEAHLRLLERMACSVIPLTDWVAWRRGARAELPARAVVLTADDGHRSQWDVMAPRLRERQWPVTLFIYPSAISHARYAMTWPQLREWVSRPGVSAESHTYWHPNFETERRRRSGDAFQRFATDQLQRSRHVLQQQLAQPCALLAWPFGLSDAPLLKLAADCGYRAAFTLGNRSATMGSELYAVPRHLMVESVDEGQLARRLEVAFAAETRS